MTLRRAKYLYYANAIAIPIVVGMTSYTSFKVLFMFLATLQLLLIFNLTVRAFHQAIRDVADGLEAASLPVIRAVRSGQDSARRKTD